MGKPPSDGGNPQQEVRVFENARFGQVRTAQGASGEPLSCLADICKVLGLQTNKVKQRINSRGWNTIPTPAEQLHGLLKEWGVMIRQSGQWLLAAKYCGQNYTKTHTHSYTCQDGTQGTNNITVWTERGRWFLHQLMAKKGAK